MRTKTLALSMIVLLGGAPSVAQDKGKLSAGESAQIAEEAYIYAFPLVMNYGTLYEYFIDKAASAYKAPINELYNTARVYTPKDTTIVTPNSDTPYSFVCMDLRAEPYVLSVPEIEKSRYYSVMLVDMYTFNYGYMGSRTTGNAAGNYMIAGPNWKGEKPEGIAKIFRCETDFSIAVVRTQLFNPADLENVKKVQAGYKGRILSAFLKKPAPPAAPEIKWPAIDKKLAEADPFAYLNFVLQFCPPVGPADVEKPLRARFAKIGIEAGKPFSLDKFTPEHKEAQAAGIKSSFEKIKQDVATVGKDENGWRVTTSAFGDRAALKGNYLTRAGAAMAGIYGNDAVEALYPLLATDSDGNKPDCSKNRYTLTFPKGQLPPVNAFWSVTMYDGKTQLLIENPKWRRADPLTLRSSLEIAEASVLKRSDEAAPVSNLFLYGRKEDFAFEQQVDDNPRQRHHVRFWRTNKDAPDGRPTWVGSAIFDEHVGLSRRTGQVTHVTAADVDTERDYLFKCLKRTGDLAEEYVVDSFHKVREGKNGGGDPWRTDGNLYVGVIAQR